MKPNTIENPTTVDRLATAEEIRAAVLPISELIEECAAEILHEIAADMGGYVRISAADLEASLLVEELTQEEDTWLN